MSKKQKRILLRIIVSAITFLFLNLISIKGFLSLFLFLIPFIIVGYDVILKSFKNIIGGQVFDENFLMSVATFGAFAIGEYSEAVAVMLFYQVGELFQSLAVRKSRKSISDLMDIRPDKAVVLRDGCEIDVSPDEVQLGEIIIVKAGEKISLDGIIVKGSASVDSSSLTGESMPLDKQTGDSVLSGTINLNGEIHIKTTSTSAESTVSKILSLVEQAAEKKAKTENFITRFARYYTPIVVISALALCLIPPLIFGGGWSEWINRSLIFLVVSCPCALVVSVPLTFFGGIGGCSKKGILVKGAVSLEKLAKADAFVFDKTGTLTKGTFKIEKVCPYNISENELYGIACSAENHSNHPISKAFEINEEIKTNYIVSEIKEIAGKGICATVNKEKYFLGNKLLMKEQGIDCAVDETGTVIYVSKNNCFIGFIVISDEIKSETAETVNELKKQGISKTFMLTGDNEKNAQSVSKEANIDKFYHSLLPDGKVEKIEEIMNDFNTTAYVGDGINDAPVLTAADVGIAMGNLGSDAAIEAADIVIMNDNIKLISQAVQLSRKTMRIVKQNIIFALSVKGIILLLGALGFVNMWIAVFGDVGVTVIAILNAMRTLYSK